MILPIEIIQHHIIIELNSAHILNLLSIDKYFIHYDMN